MSRVIFISLIILGLLLYFGIKAKQSQQQYLATALFTAAAIYTLIMLLSFGGVISGALRSSEEMATKYSNILADFFFL